MATVFCRIDSDKEALREQARVASKNEDEYWSNRAIQNNKEFDQKQQQNLNEYFERRKEMQGF